MIMQVHDELVFGTLKKNPASLAPHPEGDGNGLGTLRTSDSLLRQGKNWAEAH
jgi:hypothetical protein